MKTLKDKRRVLLCLAFVAGFLFLKLYNLSYRISDENLYFFAASLLAKGVVPYRDFFFQLLPTQIAVYALLIKVFGFHFRLLKLIHLFLTLGTGYLLYRLMSKKLGENAGMLALLLFLFSLNILWTTDFVSGVHEATFFLILSWYLFSRSAKLAGLALFVGLSVRLYILPAALGFSIYEIVKKNYRAVFQFLVYSFVPFLLVNLILFGLFGDDFLTPVWRYHFLLKFKNPGLENATSLFIKDDWVLVLFSFVGILMTLGYRYGRLKKSRQRSGFRSSSIDLGLSALAALVFQFAFLQSLTFVFQLYFVTLIPFLVVLSVLSLTDFLPLRSRRAGMFLVVALAFFNGFLYQKNLARNAALSGLEEIVTGIKALTSKKESIFGAYEVTPLLALMADRAITDNQIDTNLQRNLSGLFSTDQATQVATSSALFIQLAAVDKWTGDLLRVRPRYVDRSVIFAACKLVETYKLEPGVKYGIILLWDCRG